VLLLFMCVV